MKKTELPNCPKWLLNADTENEDVEWLNERQNYIVWKDGTWKGGIWKGGTWEDGIWEDGMWEDGTWKGGFKHIGFSKWTFHYNHTTTAVKIGCKVKTVVEWEEWFASNEEFETKRDSKQFKDIYKNFLLAKYAIENKI